MIELRTINEDNYIDCLKLKSSVENENFVDSVAYSLAEAWVYYKDTKPYAIYEDDLMIGFVSMYVGEENYQIINFLIDDAYQRQGFGTKAAKICIDYLQREYHARRVSAPVELENTTAQKFWAKLGFTHSDTVEEGYVFMRLNLSEKQAEAQSLYELAMKHIYGDGVPEDNELAMKLLTQAHDMGHVEATYNLGICYHYGYGTSENLAKAYELYLESANGGYGKGMELVGRFCNRGIYVEQDRKQAEFWLRKAMESSDPDAVEEAKKELEFGA